MNSREKAPKAFGALLSCMKQIFTDSSNVKGRHRLDVSHIVYDMTNSYHRTRLHAFT